MKSEIKIFIDTHFKRNEDDIEMEVFEEDFHKAIHNFMVSQLDEEMINNVVLANAVPNFEMSIPSHINEVADTGNIKITVQNESDKTETINIKTIKEDVEVEKLTPHFSLFGDEEDDE